MLYIILYIALACFALLDLLKNGNKVKPIVFWGLVIILIFISSVRWNVGTDWYSYLDFYRDIVSFHNNPQNLMETGFTYYNLFFHSLGAHYSVLLTVSAILMIGIKSKVFYEHKKIMMLCLFLFYCYYLADIFGVRQYLAIALCLYSVRYVQARKFWPFFLTVLIATSIHVTSIVFLLTYWLYHIKYTPVLLYTVLLMAFVGGFFNIGGRVAEVAMHIAGVDSRVGEKLMIYMKDSNDIVPGNPYIAYAVGVAKRILFIPIFVYRQRFVDEENRSKYTGYLNLLVFGNVIYLFFSLSLPVIARLSTDFLFFEIFVLAYATMSFKGKKVKMLFFLLVLLFGAFRLYSLIAVYWDLYVPFESIFAPTNIRRE